MKIWKLAAVSGGVGLVLGAGAYVALDAWADTQAEQAIAHYRADLPAGAELSYGEIDGQVFARGAGVTDLRIDPLPGTQATLHAGSADIGGLESADGALVRVGRLVLEDVQLTDRTTGDRVTAERLSVSDLPADFVARVRRGEIPDLGAVELDRLSTRDKRSDAQLRLARLTLDGLDAGQVRNLALMDLELTTRDGASLSYGRVELDGTRLGPALLQLADGQPLDSLAALRGLGDIVTEEVTTVTPTGVRSTADRAALSTGGARDTLRLQVEVDTMVTALDQGASMPPQLAAVQRLGYQDLSIRELGLDLVIERPQSGPQRFAIEALTLDWADAGRVQADLELVGTLSGAVGAMGAQSLRALGDLSLGHLRIELADQGLLSRWVSSTAEARGVSPAQVRAQIAAGLAATPAARTEAGQRMVEAMRSFVQNGGTLTLEATPAQPVPLLRTLYGMTRRPAQTLERLGLAIRRE